MRESKVGKSLGLHEKQSGETYTYFTLVGTGELHLQRTVVEFREQDDNEGFHGLPELGVP